MYGYNNILVLITPFIEYTLKLSAKLINLSIVMAVRGGGGHTKSYVLLFIGQDKSEFSQ